METSEDGLLCVFLQIVTEQHTHRYQSPFSQFSPLFVNIFQRFSFFLCVHVAEQIDYPHLPSFFCVCVCVVFYRLLMELSHPVIISPADVVKPGAASALTPGSLPTHGKKRLWNK